MVEQRRGERQPGLLEQECALLIEYAIARGPLRPPPQKWQRATANADQPGVHHPRT
jgi:hypothetical protein